MIVEKTKVIALELLNKAEYDTAVCFDRCVILTAKLEDGRILFGAHIGDDPLDMEAAHEACLAVIFEKLCAELSEPAYQDYSLSKEQASTIVAFADAAMNSTNAAEKLKLSRSAINLRLKKIQEQTGKDPRSFSDLCHLLLEARMVLQEA